MLAPAPRHAVLLVLLALGCESKSTQGTAGASSPSASAQAPSGITPELAARVLAKVGNREITLGEYAATLQRMDPFERLRYQSPDRRKQLLDELINLELLAEEARRRGLDKEPETQERVRQMLRDELLAEVRASVPAPGDIPEADARRYYDEHRDDFREPERRRVAHIALASEAEAKAVLEKALSVSAAEWGKLVETKSKDALGKPSSVLPPELAGDLGIVGPPGHARGENPNVPEALRAAIFEIDKLGGVLPKVVAAAGGFHIVRMTGKSDARDRTFADAERSIRVALVRDRIRAREAELETELKKKYPVTIDEAKLAAIPNHGTFGPGAHLQVTLLPLVQSTEPGWQAELRGALRSLADLERHFELTPSEREGARRAEDQGFPISVTPYYASLADRSDPTCPIRRQIVPRAEEADEARGDLRDPLGEEAHEVAPELIQRYPDRALLLATDRCAVYCRFCTRSRLVGNGGGPRSLERLAPAFAYLRAHPEVRDLIVSGGDPLAMATSRLTALLGQLRSIPSIETIRLATRVPVVLPSRITSELLDALRPFHPLWVMTHFNHPKELSDAARSACRRLADAGFPVMNQSVLLRGVNDDADTLKALFRGLVRERVRPYYLLQMDPVRGTSHLRTPLERGVQIMEQLQGRLSGIALPKLIVDTPGGFGKVPHGPDYVLSRDAQSGVTRFRTPRGVEVDYVDPKS